jgi:hypothetical protein
VADVIEQNELKYLTKIVIRSAMGFEWHIQHRDVAAIAQRSKTSG